MRVVSASYEIRTRYNHNLEIHNVTRVRLRGRHLFFYGVDRDVEYVASLSGAVRWVRRTPSAAEDEAAQVVELRAARSWEDLELTVSGVVKIAVKRLTEYESVYVFESDDDKLPAGYAGGELYTVNRLGQGPELVP